KDTLYCRGFATLHMIKLEDGSPAGEYHYPPGITTNIVADRNENLLFGLENNVLVRIPENVSDSSAVHWDNPLNRLYRHGEKVYLYSYPRLYLLSDDVSK
ncbi:MAG TPA: hypothetical protein VD996_16295, partial [Chitinophagaceae bacterium]|nr:hypothetical protein [Chitinophagaceae bacterium]